MRLPACLLLVVGRNDGASILHGGALAALAGVRILVMAGG